MAKQPHSARVRSGFVKIEADASEQRPQRPQRKARTDWDADGDEAPQAHADRYGKFRKKVDWQPDIADQIPLSLNPDLVRDLERDGLALQYIAEECYGKSLDRDVAQYVRNGWTRVEAGDIDGIHGDALGYGGLRLYARPVELERKAKEHDKRKAAAVVATKNQGLLSGDLPGVTLDARHPSAVRNNRINRTIEPIAIPRDE